MSSFLWVSCKTGGKVLQTTAASTPKNTIKGCVLRSWAWEQFPPTLLQHESLSYCNCSPCGCLAEDAVRSRGRKGNCPVALWKWWSYKEEGDTQAHVNSTELPDGFAFVIFFSFWELPANADCWCFELKVFAAKSLLNVLKPQFSFRKHNNCHMNNTKLEKSPDVEVHFVCSL